MAACALSVTLAVCLVFGRVVRTTADTPANCSYDDISGEWTFYVGEGGHNNSIRCSHFDATKDTVKIFTVQLLFPDIVFDSDYNRGFWTMVYNQGFEVVVNNRKYFAFSKYTRREASICNETSNGWSHDVDESNWACYVGVQTRSNTRATGTKPEADVSRDYDLSSRLVVSEKYIQEINAAQSSWKATVYPEFQNLTVEEMMSRLGGVKKSSKPRIKPSKPTPDVLQLTSQLPDHFDWRNVSGINYVSPVEDQGFCGSCYVYASLGMLESRVRILTKNKQQPIFSKNDVIECSEYSQGCAGGFNYLIAGKYAEDFGVVEQQCSHPSEGMSGQCQTDPSCKRYFTTNYHYIGGFFGACNAPLMQLELVNNGPIAIIFNAESTCMNLLHYRSGIFHKVEVSGSYFFNPWEATDHAVLVVGYGTDKEKKEDYWIVKNSWGKQWGENGYFKVRRGTDECAFESMAVVSTPVI